MRWYKGSPGRNLRCEKAPALFISLFEVMLDLLQPPLNFMELVDDQNVGMLCINTHRTLAALNFLLYFNIFFLRNLHKSRVPLFLML